MHADTLQHAGMMVASRPQLAIDSNMWHRDRTNRRIAKLFVCLTNIIERLVPHSFAYCLFFAAIYLLYDLPKSSYRLYGYKRLGAGEVPAGRDPLIYLFWIRK